MATVPLRTLAVLFSAGWGGSYVYNHTETVREIVATQLGRALQKRNAQNDSSDSAVDSLSAQVSALARDVSRAADRPVVVLGPSSSRVSALADALSLAGWGILAVGCGGAAYYIAIWKGWSVRDLAWVSQTSFDTTVSSMQKGIARVSSALASVRRDVSERMQLIETRVEAVRAALSRKIVDEVADVKAGIAEVSDDVANVRDVLVDVTGRIDTIDGKLDTATNGIMALVRVVSSLAPEVTRPGNPFWELRQIAMMDDVKNKSPPLVKDKQQPLLRRRISNGLSGILGKETAGNVDETVNVNVNYANVQIAQTSPR